MKARYTATERFSVEFEALIETLGYVKKDKATYRLGIQQCISGTFWINQGEPEPAHVANQKTLRGLPL